MSGKCTFCAWIFISLYTGSISITALAVLSAVVEQWDGTVVSHSSKSCAQEILLHIASPFNAQSLYQTPRCLHLKLEAWNALKNNMAIHHWSMFVCVEMLSIVFTDHTGAKRCLYLLDFQGSYFSMNVGGCFIINCFCPII